MLAVDDLANVHLNSHYDCFLSEFLISCPLPCYSCKNSEFSHFQDTGEIELTQFPQENPTEKKMDQFYYHESKNPRNKTFFARKRSV